VQELHVVHRPDYFKPADVDDLTGWFQSLLPRPDAWIWIAEEEGIPIGYLLAFVHEREENPFCFARRWCEIDQLAVVPSHQRRGVGRMLIEQALATARAEGIGSVELCSWAFNEAAHHAFRKLGFRPRIVRFELELVQKS
jgi:GNAT superfamily N-acetyltransferase